MHGANEARQSHLLEFVVDEVADGVGEGEAGRSGRQGGPVYVDGHSHCFSFFFWVFWVEVGREGVRGLRVCRGCGLRIISDCVLVFPAMDFMLLFVDDSSCVLVGYALAE